MGFAAVVDTVLLLVVLERVNRPLTAIWLRFALLGATLWHLGSFLHTLLRETEGAPAAWLDSACMTTMSAGLLLLSCAILHAGLRIHRTGSIAHPPADRRYLLIYIPALFVVAVSAEIVRSGSRDFMIATAGFQLPYLVWQVFANLLTAGLFVRSRHNLGESISAARFLMKFSIGLVTVTILTIWYTATSPTARHEPVLRLVTNLSPLAPTLVFAWYIFRRRLLPLVFERTLAYGAILLAGFYLHRLTISPMMSRFSEQLQFDFVVLEGLFLVALVLAYQPLRQRVREGLSYLFGGAVVEARDATRQLSVELSRRATEDVQDIAEWFAHGIRDALRLRTSWLKLEEPLNQTVSVTDNETAVANDAVTSAAATLFETEFDRWIDRSRCSDRRQLEMLRDLDLIAAFRIDYRDIHGLLLLGTPVSGDRLQDEQLNATAMLVDQFAATVHNRQLEDARQSAERRAVQQEKLSVLGLLSGSLAHEIRNPLSSMRTIATLLQEDIGGDGEHSKDVELIVSEIDRLTATTQRLLDFSRPADATHVGVAPDRVIERLLHILTHLARQRGVQVRTELELGKTTVPATDATLSEILLNLIKNAIEAATGSEDSQVVITTVLRGTAAVFAIRDNGGGIDPDLQDRMFLPFVTGKPDGTGLGLYLVGERVRELNGTITCTSDSSGTVFEVMLPL
ncbi:MAG: ATP-binding protein [Fuerstiella sp.]